MKRWFHVVFWASVAALTIGTVIALTTTIVGAG